MSRHCLILVIAITLIAVKLTSAQNAVLLPMDEGGSVEDLQLVYHDQCSDVPNEVWAACGNTGFYRSTWVGGAGNPWSAWAQYLPVKKGYGVDAIEVGGTEYVLCASQGIGLWYGSGLTGSFNPNWARPNGEIPYPDAWNQAGTHDVAFYWPEDGFGPNPNPQSQYYVILTGEINEQGQTYLPGLYWWDNTPPDIGFVPVENQPLQPRSYSHFYRDVSNKNVLYVTAPNAIYKLSGPYGRETFVKLPASTRLEDLPIARPPHPATAGLPPLPVKQ